jgi:putative addiction module CopG family antidote
MSEALPADLESYVVGKVASGGFSSREEFLCQAVRLYQELENRHQRLREDIGAGIEQADAGLCRALDMQAIQRELEAEVDEWGRPV